MTSAANSLYGYRYVVPVLALSVHTLCQFPLITTLFDLSHSGAPQRIIMQSVHRGSCAGV